MSKLYGAFKLRLARWHHNGLHWSLTRANTKANMLFLSFFYAEAAAALLLGLAGIKRLPNVKNDPTSVEWERGEWPRQRGWRRPNTEVLPIAAATAEEQTQNINRGKTLEKDCL